MKPKLTNLWATNYRSDHAQQTYQTDLNQQTRISKNCIEELKNLKRNSRILQHYVNTFSIYVSRNDLDQNEDFTRVTDPTDNNDLIITSTNEKRRDNKLERMNER